MRLFLLIIAVMFQAIRADLFTSTADMRVLLAAEQHIPDVITSYIATETARLENLKRIADEYQQQNRKTISDGLKDITNPINAFRLIKQLIFDWNNVQQIMKSSVADKFIKNVTKARMNDGIKYPDNEDLSGAAIGLLRLQDTYRLDTKDIANGILGGKQLSRALTAHDCFEIGRAAYNVEDFYHTIMWMQEAYDRNKKEQPPSASLPDILEFLGFALYKQGNLKRALALTEQLVEIAPDHPRAKGNVKWYEDLLVQEGVKRSEFHKLIPPLKNKRHSDGLDHTERNMFEALCRNEIPVSIKETSKLYCYLKMDRPFLRLAPLKVEMLRMNPLAVIFRGVLSIPEVETIQVLASPKLARATVQNSVTGALETATYRISKSAWLKGYEHEVVDRINKRLDLMTNLDMETAEELQIANYGIGGHYDPHFDFARKEETKAFESLGTGNRIATALFYVSLIGDHNVLQMSQPVLGGGTVFTELKTTYFPTVGDALFWYNLYRSGEGDLRTRHAACPVLSGMKWVSNKWIHEQGQEFRRPCGLRPSTAERYVGDLGGPEPRYAWNIRSTP